MAKSMASAWERSRRILIGIGVSKPCWKASEKRAPSTEQLIETDDPGSKLL